MQKNTCAPLKTGVAQCETRISFLQYMYIVHMLNYITCNYVACKITGPHTLAPRQHGRSSVTRNPRGTPNARERVWGIGFHMRSHGEYMQSHARRQAAARRRGITSRPGLPDVGELQTPVVAVVSGCKGVWGVYPYPI